MMSHLIFVYWFFVEFNNSVFVVVSQGTGYHRVNIRI